MNKITVLMIGCGGTGSWITQPALQVLAKSSIYGLKTRMVLIDADEVEYKNTLRQAFIESDIGKNKAAALAERYFPNFQDIEGMELSIIQKFVLDDPERTEFLEKFIEFDISEEFTSSDSLCVVVSVIDNNKTRKAIHSLFRKCKHPHVILDAGNEDVYGQVTLSSYYPQYAKKFKNYWEIHPEMLEFNDGVKAGPSCAEHDEQAANAGVVQTMSANTISANIVTSYLEKLVRFDFSVENETKFTFSEKTYNLSYY